ncbi:hypothetical protein EQ718_22780 (plasmid) [Paracoccus versutus]|uniref:Uncharacterized protein n=1 Tax=Paracoccus versutus TaxID=34007 RepID=A0AAQ0HLE4_PARVE|nr:hypothetical protein [Paracoccus versutus]KGJ12472.1 hypothetical protein IT40_01475 [Paracoccus versutus]REG55726.1 hypothetical protein ATH84_1002169 [Paracoccus versutus]WEJ81645.1 hypothetical protein EQ718_22780 [Paracoccus versutus]
MNLNRLISDLTRKVANRLLNWGIRRMNAPKPGERRTPQQRGREKAMREVVKRACQAARITRRM